MGESLTFRRFKPGPLFPSKREIFEYVRDQLAPARIVRPGRGGKSIQQISRLFGGFAPVAGWQGDELGFERILARAQLCSFASTSATSGAHWSPSARPCRDPRLG